MHNALTSFAQAMGALNFKMGIIRVVCFHFGVQFLHCLENYVYLGIGTRSDSRARHLKQVAIWKPFGPTNHWLCLYEQGMHVLCILHPWMLLKNVNR